MVEHYVTRLVEEFRKLDPGSDEDRNKGNNLILDFASFLESKGCRRDGIYDEIVHLLKGAVPEFLIRTIVPLPAVSLKVCESYRPEDLSSKTAYIHEDVMAELGLFDRDDDNLVEIETKSGKRTVANVLKLRDSDKRHDDIIRLGRMVMFNLDLCTIGKKFQPGEIVTVMKAPKPIPAVKVLLQELPSGSAYYINRKSQGIPIHYQDEFMGVPAPSV